MDYYEFSYAELSKLGDILTDKYANKLSFNDNKIDRILVFDSPRTLKKSYEIWLQQTVDGGKYKVKTYVNRFIFHLDMNGDIDSQYFLNGEIEAKSTNLVETLEGLTPLMFKDIQLYIIDAKNKLKEDFIKGLDFPVIEVNRVNIESLDEDKLKNIYTSILLTQEAINDHLKIKSNFEGNLPQRYISIVFFILNLTREEVLKKLQQLKDGDFDGFRL